MQTVDSQSLEEALLEHLLAVGSASCTVLPCRAQIHSCIFERWHNLHVISLTSTCQPVWMACDGALDMYCVNPELRVGRTSRQVCLSQNAQYRTL